MGIVDVQFDLSDLIRKRLNLNLDEFEIVGATLAHNANEKLVLTAALFDAKTVKIRIATGEPDDDYRIILYDDETYP